MARLLCFHNVARLQRARLVRIGNFDAVEMYRHTCAMQRIGPVAYVEMQMRLGRISTAAKLPNYLAYTHALAGPSFRALEVTSCNARVAGPSKTTETGAPVSRMKS